MRWYLSFATDDGFNGGCIVEVPKGGTIIDAVREAHRRKCNPGGQVLGGPVPPGNPEGMDDWPVNTILSREWLVAHGAVKMEDHAKAELEDFVKEWKQ